jgi:hypothetical protein
MPCQRMTGRFAGTRLVRVPIEDGSGYLALRDFTSVIGECYPVGKSLQGPHTTAGVIAVARLSRTATIGSSLKDYMHFSANGL